MAGPSERAFETAICESLVGSGGYSAVKVGNASDRVDDFSADVALDTAELFMFIGETQADEWEKVRKSHGSPDEAQRAFAQRLAKELDSRGTVDVLRHGIVYAGHEKAEFRLAYFRPASGLNTVVKTIAGFANSQYGSTLLVGVADDGTIHGLEDDYATFSKRGERGDHDLWGQHLKNLLDRLGKAAATLVDWEFFTIDGDDICRVSVEPSNHPVFDTKGDQQVFWWRTPVGTDPVEDPTERDRIIAGRWPA